jgi:hypothetical protein
MDETFSAINKEVCTTENLRAIVLNRNVAVIEEKV